MIPYDSGIVPENAHFAAWKSCIAEENSGSLPETRVSDSTTSAREELLIIAGRVPSKFVLGKFKTEIVVDDQRQEGIVPVISRFPGKAMELKGGRHIESGIVPFKSFPPASKKVRLEGNELGIVPVIWLSEIMKRERRPGRVGSVPLNLF